jgi:hypothetical protein
VVSRDEDYFRETAMSGTGAIYRGWRMRPIAGRIGAEISGVRFDSDLLRGQ